MTGKRIIAYPSVRMPTGASPMIGARRLDYAPALQSPDAERREKTMIRLGTAALLAALEREHPRIVHTLRMKPNAQAFYPTKGSK